MCHDFLLRIGVGHQCQSPCPTSDRPDGFPLLKILHSKEFEIERTQTVKIKLNLDTERTSSRIGFLCRVDPCLTKPFLDQLPHLQSGETCPARDVIEPDLHSDSLLGIVLQPA